MKKKEWIIENSRLISASELPELGVAIKIESVINGLNGLRKIIKRHNLKPEIDFEMSAMTADLNDGFKKVTYPTGEKYIKINIHIPPYISQLDAYKKLQDESN